MAQHLGLVQSKDGQLWREEIELRIRGLVSRSLGSFAVVSDEW